LRWLFRSVAGAQPKYGENASYRVALGFEKHPVANVSWFGAQAYSLWAGLRLPTEMQWEKAARGADGQIFPWGNRWSPEKLRWHGGHLPTEDTAPVESFENGCSPYGIFPDFSDGGECRRMVCRLVPASCLCGLCQRRAGASHPRLRTCRPRWKLPASQQTRVSLRDEAWE
jgi:hypothetical protein